jgi:hypothetical protein
MSSPPDNSSPTPVPPLNGDRGRRLKITPELNNCGVIQFYKEGIRMSMLHHMNGKSDRNTVILFSLHKDGSGPEDGFGGTLREFERVATRKGIDQLVIQKILVELSTDPYNVDVLQYYEEDDAESRKGIGTPITTVDFFIDDNEAKQERDQEHDPNAAEIAEQEYNDEGLVLLTVEQALKLDKPQRVRIIGQIQRAKGMFDLIKQISVTCDNNKCTNANRFKEKRFNLKSGLYSMGDFPYVFPGGPAEAEKFLKCQYCQKFMIAMPTNNSFQNARMIELEHIDIKEDGMAAILNSSNCGMRHIDTLPVRISGIHTQ